MSVKVRQQRLYDYLKSLGLYVWGVPVCGQPDDDDVEIDYICVSVTDPRPVGEDRPYLRVVNPPVEQRSSSRATGVDST